MSSPERPCRRFPPGHRRVLFFLFALALATPLGLATGGEDDDALPHRVELSKARLKELTERRHDEALRMYAALLEEPVLDADIRGDALLGLARCYRALGQLGQAEDTWKRVLRDETLPLKVREQAEKDWNAVKAERGRVDQTQRREEDFQRLLARRREEAQGLVAQAQRAFDDGRLELARQLCLDAKKLGPGNVEADALLARINRAIPDR
ncbi:MAG: tetratricopeptide repeat protein, partial [Planctomycetota bacterium]